MLQGEIIVTASDGANVALAPGDAVRVETTGRGGWQLGNRADEPALLAIVQIPPPSVTG